jgi:hypothetical protein
MKPVNRILVLAAPLALFFLFSSCNKQDDPDLRSLPPTSLSRAGKPEKTLYGPSVPIGLGVGRAWVSQDLSGNPTAAGIDLSEAALKNLPEMNQEYILKFNPNAATHFYKYVCLNWSAHGHIPNSIYNISHFDVHFFNIEDSERMMIGSHGSAEITMAPLVQYIPSNYEQLIGGAPTMGAHWFDLLAPEFHGSVFTKTFIWGSNNGKFIFWEPMITRDYLLTHPDSETALRQPVAFQQDGWYPQSYLVRYSTSPNKYTIALTNLTFQQGQ